MPLTLPDGRSIPDADRTRCEVWSRVMGYYRQQHRRARSARTGAKVSKPLAGPV